jgi:hypothetical protein
MIIRKTFSVVAMALALYFGRCDVQAQTREKKLEFSALYTTIDLQVFDRRESGGGVRLSYNVNKYLAVEAEGNLFEFSIGDHPTDDLLAAQGLLGIKAGLRNRWAGVFAKVRPGVANFPKLRGPRSFCFLGQSCDKSRKGGNRLAVDAGAVLELYPIENVIVRVDVGDTMIRFTGDQFSGFPDPVRIKDGFSHNAQLTASVGFRF